MTPHRTLKREVGVRELHDGLSRYLAYVADGGEVLVTMRGRPVARLSPLDDRDPLAELRARGLVSEPSGEWVPRRRDRAASRAPVSALVSEQRH
jgi:prevent-host-death family protein